MDHDDIPNRFSIGFPIDLERMEVALVRKKRGPAFNIGKLNGCGGHQKKSESAVGCIRREANEELGIYLPEPGQWQQFHYERRTKTLSGNCLSFFVANVPNVRTFARKMTDEDVEIIMIGGMLDRMAGNSVGLNTNVIHNLGKEGSDFVYNLGYLIPMAVAWLLNPEHHYTGA